MRTTLNIDDHLLAEVKVIAAREHRSIGDVVNQALRRHLDSRAEETTPRGAFSFPDFQYPAGLRVGVDLYDRDQVESLLGTDAEHAVS